MDRVAIVYDVGGATPLDILTSLDNVVEPIFVLPESEHNSQVAGMLTGLVPVARRDELAAYKPRGITTFSDFQLETTALLAEELGLPFHSPAAAHNLTRKHRQRTILNEHGIGDIPTGLITDAASARRVADLVPLPGVLKPNRGTGATHTYLVESRKELLRLVTSLVGADPCMPDRDYVLETRIPGAYVDEPWGHFVSVESAVHEAGVQHLGVTGKFALSPPFRERGGYLPVRAGSVDMHAVLDLTTRALTALEAGNSICHTEIMLTEDGPRIIEVNGRLGGNIHDLFLRAHCLDLIRLATGLALGEPPRIAPSPCDQVVFHYYGLAPMRARRLVAVPGIDTVRDLSSVDRMDLRVKPGSALDWRHGFLERIYACAGRVRDHEELADFVARIDELLEIEYEYGEDR